MGILDNIAANYAATEAEFNKQWRLKYGTDAPKGNTSERPGDTMASQAKFTDALRQQGVSPVEAFMTGFRRTAASGPSVGLVRAATGIGDNGVPEEARRKMDYANHEVSPVADSLGMIAGAPFAAADYVASTIPAVGGFLGLGGRAAVKGVIGEGVAPIVLRAKGAGLVQQGVNKLGNAALRAGGYLWNESSALAKTGAGLAGAIGLGSAMATSSGSTQPAPVEAPTGPLILDREAARTGEMSPARQWLAQIRKPDGSLIDGITPGEADLARIAAEVEYNNNRPGSGRRGMVAAPVGMAPGPNGGAVYVPGGEARQVAWQNQYGNSAGIARSDLKPASATTAASAAAPAAAPVAGGQSAAQDVYTPGAMADAMDQYEATHPGNRNGTLTTKEYTERKAMAERDREDSMYAALGAQLGFADPKLAVTLGRRGQLTHGMVNAAILQQQVRSSEKLDAKTDIYRRKIAAVEAAYAAAEKMPDSDPQKAQIMSRAQAVLDEMFNTINAPGSVVTIPAPPTGN